MKPFKYTIHHDSGFEEWNHNFYFFKEVLNYARLIFKRGITFTVYKVEGNIVYRGQLFKYRNSNLGIHFKEK